MNNDPFSEANGSQASTSAQADSQFQSRSQANVQFQSQSFDSEQQDQRVIGNIIIASFVPPSASGVPGIESLAKSHPYLFPLHNVPQGCSIVVTIDSKGGYVWTFIPMARGPSPHSAASDEGDWPRMVSMLGEIKLLTKERWDELKCDPEYDCYIPLPPGIPIVSSRASTSKNTTESLTTGKTTNTTTMPPPPVPRSPPLIPKRHNTRSPTPFPKRTAAEFSDSQDASPHKRQRTYVESVSESDSLSGSISGSDTEIEELLEFKSRTYQSTKSKLRRAQEKEARAHDNLKSASFRMSNMMNNLPNLPNTSPNANASMNGHTEASGGFSGTRKEREKVAMETDPVQTKRHHDSSPELSDVTLEEVEDDEPRESNFTSIHSYKRPKFSFDSGVDEKQRAWEKRQREFQRGNRRYARSPSLGAGMAGIGRNKKRKEENFWQDVDFNQFKGRAFAVDPDESEETPTPSVAPEVKQERDEQTHRSHHESGTTDSPIYVSESDDDAEGETAGESTHSESEKKARKARFNPHALDPDYRDPFEEAREARIRASKQKLEEFNAYDAIREAKRKLEEERVKLEEQLKERMRRQEQYNRERAEPQRPRWWGPSTTGGNFWADFDNQKYFTRAPWNDGHRQSSGRSQGYTYPSSNRPGSDRTYTSANATNGSSSSSRQSTSNSNNTHQRASYAYTSIPSSISTVWSSRNALERYNKLAASFDSFKPTPEKLLPNLDEIPWPVLLPPGFSIDQVDWTTVEKFFTTAESLMGGKTTTSGKTAWKEFLKVSTRRFHPDRWRARGFIGDKGYGPDIEDKVNHVAKVLTPLYRAVN